MRAMERKVLNAIDKNGITFEQVLEILDRTPTSEMKKSYPDENHFQSDRFFAKLILNTLSRNRLIEKKNNKYFKIDMKKEKE